MLKKLTTKVRNGFETGDMYFFGAYLTGCICLGLFIALAKHG